MWRLRKSSACVAKHSATDSEKEYEGRRIFTRERGVGGLGVDVEFARQERIGSHDLWGCVMGDRGDD